MAAVSFIKLDGVNDDVNDRARMAEPIVRDVPRDLGQELLGGPRIDPGHGSFAELVARHRCDLVRRQVIEGFADQDARVDLLSGVLAVVGPLGLQIEVIALWFLLPGVDRRSSRQAQP